MLNQPSESPGKPATRTPVFLWSTLALLALLVLVGAAAAIFLVFQAKTINSQGGYGWLMAGAVYVVAITLVCVACVVGAAVSLFRRESHRRLSITILVISSLVVLAFGPFVIRVTRAVLGLRQPHPVATSAAVGAPHPAPVARPAATVPPAGDEGASAPVSQVVETPPLLALKSKVWAAVRTHDAGALVDCFHVEERYNTPRVREESRNQMEILLRGETTEVYFLEIPARELADIRKFQQGGSASSVRFSLMPRLMLRIQQKAQNGSVGRSFLIGEQDGKWYIITLGGHVT